MSALRTSTLTAGKWRYSIIRIYWDDETEPGKPFYKNVYGEIVIKQFILINSSASD
jgi:hypothetical protein